MTILFILTNILVAPVHSLQLQVSTYIFSIGETSSLTTSKTSIYISSGVFTFQKTFFPRLNSAKRVVWTSYGLEYHSFINHLVYIHLILPWPLYQTLTVIFLTLSCLRGSVGIYYSVFGSTSLPNHSYITLYFPLFLLQWHTEYSTGTVTFLLIIHIVTYWVFYKMSLDEPQMWLEERGKLLEKKPNEPQKWPISPKNGPQKMSWEASQVTQKTWKHT